MRYVSHLIPEHYGACGGHEVETAYAVVRAWFATPNGARQFQAAHSLGEDLTWSQAAAEAVLRTKDVAIPRAFDAAYRAKHLLELVDKGLIKLPDEPWNIAHNAFFLAGVVRCHAGDGFDLADWNAANDRVPFGANLQVPRVVPTETANDIVVCRLVNGVFVDDGPALRAAHERERRACRWALAIARGVLQHPHAFAFGMPNEEKDDFDVLEASVSHRLGPLGFTTCEIARACEAAYPVAAAEYDTGRITYHEPQWGRA